MKNLLVLVELLIGTSSFGQPKNNTA